jgi:hypothetical protein
MSWERVPYVVEKAAVAGSFELLTKIVDATGKQVVAPPFVLKMQSIFIFAVVSERAPDTLSKSHR